MATPQLLRHAGLSECGRYRYFLSRIWNPSPAPILIGFNALNPSKADADIDDPTVLKLCAFGRRWGYDGYILTNLWPLRATDPDDLFTFHGDIVEQGTRELIIKCFRDMNVSEVVCCWGTHAKRAWRDKILTRGDEVKRALRNAGFKLSCFGLNQDGTPKHPVRLGFETQRRPYGEAA